MQKAEEEASPRTIETEHSSNSDGQQRGLGSGGKGETQRDDSGSLITCVQQAQRLVADCERTCLIMTGLADRDSFGGALLTKRGPHLV